MTITSAALGSVATDLPRSSADEVRPVGGSPRRDRGGRPGAGWSGTTWRSSASCGWTTTGSSVARAWPGTCWPAGCVRSGVPLSVGRQAANLLDQAQPVPGFAVMDEVRISADPDTLALLPHAPGSAAMLGDLLTRDGAPWGACPRAFLRDAVAEAHQEGYAVVAAFEPEFTLLRDGVPFDDGLTLDNEAFDVTNDYVIALIRALRSVGGGGAVPPGDLAGPYSEAWMVGCRHGYSARIARLWTIGEVIVDQAPLMSWATEVRFDTPPELREPHDLRIGQHRLVLPLRIHRLLRAPAGRRRNDGDPLGGHHLGHDLAVTHLVGIRGYEARDSNT